MLRTMGAVVTGVVVCCSSAASAGIPEPDAILYGTALVNGAPVAQQNDVVIVARLDSGQEIGRYNFADCNADGVRDACELSCQAPGCLGIPGCGTATDINPVDGLLDDCPGNLYALKIRCESTPDGVTPSGQAAILDPTHPTSVHILLQTNGEPEKFARDLQITDRGIIRQVTLSELNLAMFGSFASCIGGPSDPLPGGTCSDLLFATADYDGDGDVDLRDYAVVQIHFVEQ